MYIDRINDITQKICAGIVVYYPNINEFVENLKNICKQVNSVVVINNGISSQDNAQLKEVIDCAGNVTLINNNENEGIAYALNEMCKWAKENGYTWILTLDQDSVCNADMIERMLPRLSEIKIGIVCPKVVFRNTEVVFKTTNKLETSFPNLSLDACITSGSLTNIAAWEEVNGFDDWLFIDHVDNDFCKALTLNGYRIVRENRAILFQQAGEMRCRRTFTGKYKLLTNYSPLRNYYIVRNHIYFIKKYRRTISIARETLKIVYIQLHKLIYEGNKAKTITSAFHGMVDGFKAKAPHNCE